MNVMEKTPEDILIKYYEEKLCSCCNKEQCKKGILLTQDRYTTKLFCEEYKRGKND